MTFDATEIFFVNELPDNTDDDAALLELASGNFVAVYASIQQPGGISHDVYARVFAPDGTALGAEIRMNFDVGSVQIFPQLMALPGGGFRAFWSSQGTLFPVDGDVFFRDFAEDLTPATQWERVLPDYDGYGVVLGVLPDGGFATGWHELVWRYNDKEEKERWEKDAIIQIRDVDGKITATSGFLNDSVQGDHSVSRILALRDDSLLALLAHDGRSDAPGVSVRRLGTDGTVLGPEHRIHEAGSDGYMGDVELTLLKSGEILLTALLTSGSADGPTHVRAMILDESGAPKIPFFDVQPTATGLDVSEVAAAALDDGSFLIGVSGGAGVVVHQFNADFTREGPALRLDDEVDYDRNGGQLEIEALAGGKAVVTWSAIYGTPDAPDARGTEVVGRVLSPPEKTTLLGALDWGTQLTVEDGVVKVYFAEVGERFANVSSQGFDAGERAAVLAALRVYEDYIDPVFTITEDAGEADFIMVAEAGDPDGTLGVMYAPGEVNGGVALINTTATPWLTPGALDRGGSGFVTLAHEFGHGLGLAHPHDTGGTSTRMAGVASKYHDYGDDDLNQGVFTTMSYNDGWPLGPDGAAATGSAGYGLQGGPGALDVMVLQEKYGANDAKAAGDDRYILPTENRTGTFYRTIWDVGGKDTIENRSADDAVIDLRPATGVYGPGGGGYVSYAQGFHGGFTIAAGVRIEVALGGIGDDVIHGSDRRDVLKGRGGEDQLSGHDGADRVLGGDGDDVIHAGAGNDRANGQDGDDLVFAGEGAQRLKGGRGVDFVSYAESPEGVTVHLARNKAAGGWAEDDRIDGFEGVGGSDGGDDVLRGGAAAETFEAYAGDDRVAAGGGDDAADGGDGDDLLAGGRGDDWLRGRGDDDTLKGNAGKDTLEGGDGEDLLIGGRHRDRLEGGADDDVFAFAARDAVRDVILDFQDGDAIKILSGAASFAELEIRARSDDALVFFGAGKVLLKGVAPETLDESDFIF